MRKGRPLGGSGRPTLAAGASASCLDRSRLAALFHAAHGLVRGFHGIVLAHRLEIFRVGLLVHDHASAAIHVDGDEIRIGEPLLLRDGDAGEGEDKSGGELESFALVYLQ